MYDLKLEKLTLCASVVESETKYVRWFLPSKSLLR
jgi:hypothetical protein